MILPWQVVIHSSRCNSRKNILRVVVVGSVKIGYHFTLVLFFHNFALKYLNFQSPFLNVIVLNVDCLDALFAFQFFFFLLSYYALFEWLITGPYSTVLPAKI